MIKVTPSYDEHYRNANVDQCWMQHVAVKFEKEWREDMLIDITWRIHRLTCTSWFFSSWNLHKTKFSNYLEAMQYMYLQKFKNPAL